MKFSRTKDMSESGESNHPVDVDYTPYITVPLSADQDATYYVAHVEPALLATLEPLDIEFFFTLTILTCPCARRGGSRFPSCRNIYDKRT